MSYNSFVIVTLWCYSLTEKRYPMKTMLKILAVIVLLLAIAVIILPIIFKGGIIELAKKEINNNVNASVEFADMDVSLVKNFPNFSLTIHALTIVGKDEFAKDTLANIASTNIVIDLFSVFSGDVYKVNKITMDSPRLLIKVLKSGNSNYDIALPDEKAEAEPQVEEQSAYSVKLKQFNISNGQLIYDDEESDLQVFITGLNNSLSGDFSENFTNLKVNTLIEQLNLTMDGMEYLSRAKLSYKANIGADLKNSIYTLGENELKLNELQLTLDGSVSMLEEGTNLVLTFNAPDNNFKSLLSLLPAIYTKDFESVKADGKITIEGSLKGIYTEEKLPAFNINVLVNNGMFSYPDLPKSVTDINFVSNIKNKGGDVDNTIVDVSRFEVKLGANPFTASLLLKTPVSDPDIDATLKGTLDLSTFKEFYPIEDELSGKITTDISLKGKMSSIENERYDEFVALGSLLVQNISYKTASLMQPIVISTAQLNFSPQYLDLVSFKMNTGKSDLNANGKVRNYLSYALADGELRAKLTTTSNYFNIDNLYAEDETLSGDTPSETDESSGASSESSIVEIPDNIDFILNTSFNELVYNDIEMKAVKGKVRMHNRVLNMENLQMDVAKGLMMVSGSYSTLDPKLPEVNLDFKLKKLDIPTAYKQFGVMQTYLPIAEKTIGNFSANLNVYANLNEEMNPVYESLTGAGQLNTSKISVNGLNTLSLIADALKFDQLKNLDLNELLVKFQLIDGKLAVQPFDLKYKNITANVEGTTSFDQSIAYVMGLSIPREELGNSANQALDQLMKEAQKLGGNFTLPENISFDVLIGGTLSKPTVKTGLAEGGNSLIENAKEEMIKDVSREVGEKADQILAEAEKQADAIVAEAEKQAKALRKSADEAISKLNAETDKQAEALMTEAKKNGLVAELAAKETIKQLRKESDKQVQKLSNEADNKGNALINTAKKTAAGIRAEARKKADKLMNP